MTTSKQYTLTSLRTSLYLWKLEAEKIDRLLDHASLRLCESYSPNDANSSEIELVDAVIDGAAALARNLCTLLDQAEGDLVEVADAQQA